MFLPSSASFFSCPRLFFHRDSPPVRRYRTHIPSCFPAFFLDSLLVEFPLDEDTLGVPSSRCRSSPSPTALGFHPFSFVMYVLPPSDFFLLDFSSFPISPLCSTHMTVFVSVTFAPGRRPLCAEECRLDRPFEGGVSDISLFVLTRSSPI